MVKPLCQLIFRRAQHEAEQFAERFFEFPAAAAYYDPDKSRAAYPTRDAYLADLVDFTRREIQELRRLGCEYIQIDAPQYAGLPDEKIREGYRQRGSDPDRLLDACIELDNAIIDGHAGVTFGIHICRGNYRSMFYASGGYDRIAQQVFRRSRFQRFLLEYDDARSGTFEPLAYVPDDRIVVLGLVSTKTAPLETVEGLRARIAEASRPTTSAGSSTSSRPRLGRCGRFRKPSRFTDSDRWKLTGLYDFFINFFHRPSKRPDIIRAHPPYRY